jgi:hypothetical protein
MLLAAIMATSKLDNQLKRLDATVAFQTFAKSSFISCAHNEVPQKPVHPCDLRWPRTFIPLFRLQSPQN